VGQPIGSLVEIPVGPPPALAGERDVIRAMAYDLSEAPWHCLLDVGPRKRQGDRRCG
jgi:hypothetical protein